MSVFTYILVVNPIDIGRLIITSLYDRKDHLLRCSVHVISKFNSKEEISDGTYDLRSGIFSYRKSEILLDYKEEINNALGVCLQTRQGLVKLLQVIEEEKSTSVKR